MALRSSATWASVVLGLAASASCGGGSASPASPTPPQGGSGSLQSFFVAFSPISASYSATLEGQTYTAAGLFPIRLAPGTYQINGSFRGNALGITFTAASLPGTAGGVQSGSVRSLAGPEPTVQACQILYFYSPTAAGGAPAVQQDFRMQFTVTPNAGNACQ